MKNIRLKKKLLLIVLCAIYALSMQAQGDGPRAWMLAPKGVWGLDAKYLNLNQNIVPAGNLFIPSADVKVNVVPLTFFHTFSLGGRFAMAQASIMPGSASGSIYPPTPGLPDPTFNASGISDGFVSLKVGLVGAPALDAFAFSKKQPGFSMLGMFRVWYSGTYDASKPLNLGTNRMTYEFGLPMSIPFGNNPKMPFWVETVPSLQFYGANNNPTVISRSDKTKQKPLFIWENHLTKNLTPKFWAGLGIRAQAGGELIVDGVDQGNSLNIVGLSVDAGYQLLAPLSIKASYGNVIWGYNGADSRMIRVGATFSYINLNKLKAQSVK
jgi:hypothetical protein